MGGHLVAVVCYHFSCHFRCIFTSHVAFHSPSRFQFLSSRRILLTPGVACCLFESCHRDCRKIFDCRSLIVRMSVGQCALCPVAQPLTYVARRVGKLPTTVKGPMRRVRRRRDLHRTWLPTRMWVYRSCWEYTTVRWRSNISEGGGIRLLVPWHSLATWTALYSHLLTRPREHHIWENLGRRSIF